jgi:dihydroorotate dehydrogenase
MGFNNDGLEAAIEKLKETKRKNNHRWKHRKKYRYKARKLYPGLSGLF